jgi:hypothetical protein
VSETNRFDRVFILFDTIILVGLFLDGWAHNNLPSTLETFFTPWHAVLYSGFLLTAIWLVYPSVKHLAQGQLMEFLGPYRYSLVGVFLFFLGGIGDSLWHILFGIEVGFEALISPTHLLLATGGFLIGLGPILKIASGSRDKVSDAFLAALLFSHLSSLLLFFTQYHSPFWSIYPAAPSTEALVVIATTGFMMHTMIFTAFIFYMYRLIGLRYGMITLYLTANIGLVGSLSEFFSAFYLGFFIAVVIDLVCMSLIGKEMNPHGVSRTKVRAVAVLIPLLLWVYYFVLVELILGILWSFTLVSGVVVLAVICSVFVSYLIYPVQIEN